VTRFQFRLQTVLEWREKQLELEESRFRQRMAEIADLDRARDSLLAAEREAEIELRQSASISGQDLMALTGYRRWVAARARKLAADRAEAQKRLAAQETAMLEARRRCRLLERLKERRLAEWEAARDRELDALASESYLAGWVRDRIA